MIRISIIFCILSAIIVFGTWNCGSSGSSPPPPIEGPCSSGSLFIGDPNLDPELVITTLEETNDTFISLNDGDSILLSGRASQGGVGSISIVGARVMNMDICGIDLKAFVRDPINQNIRLDERTVNLTVASDGWGEADTQSVAANIPMCPNQWSASDVYGTTYALTVSLLDQAQRFVEKTIQVTPACAAATSTFCQCLCQANYQLGQPC